MEGRTEVKGRDTLSCTYKYLSGLFLSQSIVCTKDQLWKDRLVIPQAYTAT
jgi:hypothetical protein